MHSARGYYDNAYDFGALTEQVLRPLGPGGSGSYATRVHDMTSDAIVEDERAHASAITIVVFDCTFLQRGALRQLWDQVIYLDVTRAVAVDRAVSRDASRLGGPQAARAAYEARYMAACDIYVSEERPVERATIVVGHDDPEAPVVTRT